MIPGKKVRKPFKGSLILGCSSYQASLAIVNDGIAVATVLRTLRIIWLVIFFDLVVLFLTGFSITIILFGTFDSAHGPNARWHGWEDADNVALDLTILVLYVGSGASLNAEARPPD